MSPRFNHIALSVPADLLDDEGRRDILDFYGRAFGWQEMDTMTLPRQRLVLQAYTYEQFVYLIAEDRPMSCPRLDHFGMSVESRDEFDDFYGRVRSLAGGDDRVDVIDAEVEHFGDFLRLHNFYVGFLLPMMIEVQYFDWTD